MLSAHSITHKYNDFIALDSVSIDIKPGEIVGLLGKNGAGKSSLMRVLTGFMQPTEGIVYFDGLELQDNAKIIQAQIGYLPENNILYDEMSVFDYLAFVSEIRGVPKSKRMELLSKAIFKTGLESKVLSSIFELSKGYKQRVGVAQALIHDPKLLILDEPTNGLDPTQVLQIRDLIKELKTANTAVLVSSHILNEVELLCDRVIMLDSGKKTVDVAMNDFIATGKIKLTISSLSQELHARILDRGDVESIEISEQVKDKIRIVIKLQKGADLDKAMASIVKKFVENKVEIYAAKPEERGDWSTFLIVMKKEGQTLLDKILAIYKKENYLFFSSSSSLVFFGAFLGVVIFNFFWVERFFSRNIMDIRPLFESLPFALNFFVQCYYNENVERRKEEVGQSNYY